MTTLYFFEKNFGFGQVVEFLCPVEVEFRMDHDRVNGDLGRVELWRHFEKTLKQFSASRRSAKAFLARKFILFGLHSLCNWRKNYYVLRIIGLGDELRLRRHGNQFYRWIRTWRRRGLYQFRVSPQSQETSNDSSDDDAAYTDEPLGDAEWIEKYQEEMKANEEL